MSDSASYSTPHHVRAKAIRDSADQLAGELVGPFPKSLKRSGQEAIGYLRSYAGDCLFWEERTHLAVDLMERLREVLECADRPHSSIRDDRLGVARATLRRAQREFRHVI